MASFLRIYNLKCAQVMFYLDHYPRKIIRHFQLKLDIAVMLIELRLLAALGLLNILKFHCKIEKN